MRCLKIAAISLCAIVCSSVGIISISWAQGFSKQPVRITVIGNKGGPCGSHVGVFEGFHNGKKIEVSFSYNPNRANPIQHPVKVYNGTREIKDWYSYLCEMGDQKSAIKGRKVDLIGRWKDQKNFEAYSIYLPADLP